MEDVVFQVYLISPPNRDCRVFFCTLFDQTGHITRPFAMAFVNEYHNNTYVLDYVIVPDDYRRQGYGKRLVQECQRHWPGLSYNDDERLTMQLLIDNEFRQKFLAGTSIREILSLPKLALDILLRSLGLEV